MGRLRIRAECHQNPYDTVDSDWLSTVNRHIQHEGFEFFFFFFGGGVDIDVGEEGQRREILVTSAVHWHAHVQFVIASA